MKVGKQTTLRVDASVAGIGVHSGLPATLTLHPADADTGIVFLRTGLDGRPDCEIRADVRAVTATEFATVLGDHSGPLCSTAEHVLAALAGLGVDNAVVEIDGPEVPIMDGSCVAFVEAIDTAGRKGQVARRQFIEVLEPVVVSEDEKSAALLPADGFEIAFEIAFDSSAIGRQRLELVIGEVSFREELATNRTFGFLHEVDALRQAGLARGGTLDNTLVIEGDKVINPGGLRRTDEFVRHKMLDAVGDLYLLGAPLIGRYEGLYAGHGLNNALVRALLARPQAWRWAEPQSHLAKAV